MSSLGICPEPMDKEQTDAVRNSVTCKKLKLILFISMVAAIITIDYTFDLKEKITFDAIYAQLDILKYWAHQSYGPLLFIAVSASFILLHLPELVVIIAGGIIYNFWEALLYTWIGSSLGVISAFLISRFFLREHFRPFLSQSFLRKFEQRLKYDGFAVMLILRLILFLFPPLNWALGASAITLRNYIAGSVIGVLPWLAGILWATSQLQQVRSLADVLSLETFVVLGTFGAGLLVIFWIRRRFFIITRPDHPPED